MQDIVLDIIHSVTGASSQQLNAIIALAAISVAGFAIYAVLTIARIENRLMSVDSITDWENWGEKAAFPNCYRIAFIDNYKHGGTQQASIGDLTEKYERAAGRLAKESG
jgi:hypothetical protein